MKLFWSLKNCILLWNSKYYSYIKLIESNNIKQLNSPNKIYKHLIFKTNIIRINHSKKILIPGHYDIIIMYENNRWSIFEYTLKHYKEISFIDE